MTHEARLIAWNGSMPLRSDANEDAIALPKPVKNWLGFGIVGQPLGGDARHNSST